MRLSPHPARAGPSGLITQGPTIRSTENESSAGPLTAAMAAASSLSIGWGVVVIVVFGVHLTTSARADGTAGDAHSSCCDRPELAAAAERALALGEPSHCSILPPAPDGPRPRPISGRATTLSVRAWATSVLAARPQFCPQRPFSLPQKCSFAGRRLVPLPGFEPDCPETPGAHFG